MKIRCETAADQEAIAQVNTLAFNRENEAQLIDRIRQTQQFIPQLSLVAEVDGLVVGHILLSYVELVGDTTKPVLALAPMAVHPQFQRQGIGSALVQESLAIADSMGEALVVVLGHPEFYPRFGFLPAVRYAIASPFEVPEQFFMVKLLTNYQETYRGIVTYPPTFNDV